MENSAFNSLEVLEMAQEIERKGMNFYRMHAANVGEDVKSLFMRLHAEENDHFKRFKAMEEEVREKGEDYDYLYEPEVVKYLKTLVEFSIFPDDLSAEEAKVQDINDVFLIAITAEKESILFYQELLKHNKDSKQAEIIEKLIEEEKQHLIDVSEISRTFK